MIRQGLRLPALWRLSVFVAVCVALLPLDIDAPIFQSALTDWDLPQRIYQLIKPSIFWAALGLIGGLAVFGRPMRLWGLVAVPVLLVCAPLFAEPVLIRDVIEVLGLLPGLACGLWLGEHAAASVPLAAEDSALNPALPAAHGNDGVDTQPESDRVARRVRAQPEERPQNVARSRGVEWVRRFIALVILACVGYAVLGFPRWNLALGVGLVAYLAALWRYPLTWLLVLPAALPIFDLAFWTGRYFFDEFDMLVLVTLAGFLWQRSPERDSPIRLPHASVLLALSVVLSTAIALFPWQPIDANAFSSYWSQYNSLRVAKGFVWGALLFLMGRAIVRSGHFHLLAAGMVVGLLGVSVAALWETWLFTGFGTATDYRVTATFSSMHTGGGHIEAYLACAMPFAWYLLISQRMAVVRGLAALAFVLGGYAILTTVARGGLVAFLVASGVLAVISVRLITRRQEVLSRGVTALLMMAVAAVVLVLGVTGGVFVKQRLAQTGVDAGTRFEHWRATVGMIDPTPQAWLLGAGLGSFPRRYLFAHTDLELGTYRINGEDENPYLSLNSGGTLYMAHAVQVKPRSIYRLELDLRSDGQSGGVELSLCEKKLFNSHRCQWGQVSIDPHSGEWRHVEWTFNSAEIGAGKRVARRPIQLSLYNPAARTVVDIDNVGLFDADGVDLIANGDFAHGLDRWFFKSGEHLPWHAKNLWVHLLFEQGLLGVLALGMLAWSAMRRLGRAAWRGVLPAATLLASGLALFTLSFVDSLVDAPRLAALLVFVLLLGATYPEDESCVS